MPYFYSNKNEADKAQSPVFQPGITNEQRVRSFIPSSYGDEEPVYMEVRGPQISEVTCGGSPHLSCKHDQINMRDYMDGRVTPTTEGYLAYLGS